MSGNCNVTTANGPRAGNSFAGIHPGSVRHPRARNPRIQPFIRMVRKL
jgi:hypothetical protein